VRQKYVAERWPIIQIQYWMQLFNVLVYLVPMTLPIVLQNNDIATNVFYAVKNMMTMDDPAIVIQWNDQVFRNVATMLGCRNGIAGQTKNV
jgi:hypothetical protein